MDVWSIGMWSSNEKRYKTPYIVGWKKHVGDVNAEMRIMSVFDATLCSCKIESINKIIKHYSYIPKDKLKAKQLISLIIK